MFLLGACFTLIETCSPTIIYYKKNFKAKKALTNQKFFVKPYIRYKCRPSQSKHPICAEGSAIDRTALYSSNLSCTLLHYAALHCTALQCNELPFSALYDSTLHCTALHCTAMKYFALHCTVLHCTTLN